MLVLNTILWSLHHITTEVTPVFIKISDALNLYRTKVAVAVTQVRVKCLKKLRPTADFMAFKCRTLRVKGSKT